jgi:hypothetical protein
VLLQCSVRHVVVNCVVVVVEWNVCSHSCGGCSGVKYVVVSLVFVSEWKLLWYPCGCCCVV